ncbi:MAG TPA: flagellar hook-associated protein FlgK, partial [Accumulibacter sp.]|nr:flagellar hook-associated protein FlgK [Accumulibacter sp.]
MATSGLIGTGITGLMAAQIGLQTAEHNITNANTAGFTRQRSSQASNLGMSTGAGFIGMGTHVSTVERLYSRFLTDQVNRSQSSTSQLDTYHQQISQIDNLLGDSSSGLSPALQNFFTSAQQVANNPADLPSRQAMIAGAQSLSARYIAMADQLAQMARAVDGEITSTISGINAFAEQIGSLNQRIIVAQAPTGQPANDMLDTRDQLVAELNKLVKTTTTINSDGSYNVFIGNGQQLVVGAQVMGMTTQPSNSDQSR